MIDPGSMNQLAAMADAADAASSDATRGDGSGGVNWSAVLAARKSFNDFWSLQGSVQAQGDAGQQSTVNALNARVHAAWGRMENWLAEFDDPSTWAQHSQAAQEAFNDAASLASAANQSARQVSSYGMQSKDAKNTPAFAARTYIDTSYSSAFSDQLGKVADTLGHTFLGIPVWTWGLLTLGSVAILVTKGRR